MELRKAGATFEAIASALGVSAQQAWRDVRAALAAVVARRDTDAEALIALELERLDQVVLAMLPRARDGNTRAAAVLVRASESRRRLLGLDSPVRAELTGAHGGPVAVAAARAEESLPDEELARRARLAYEALRRHRPELPETPPEPPTLTPEDLYARELERRRAGGR